MRWQQFLPAAGFLAAWCWRGAVARADEGPDCRHVERANLVRCATGASVARQAAGAAIEAAEGRAMTTDPWFPSAPSLGLTGARRTAGGEGVWNWSATLGVELNLAGERGARRRAFTDEKEAETRRADGLERQIAVEAFRSYFELIAAREASRLARELEAASKRVWDAASAAAARGALPGVEADLAEVAYLRVLQRRISSEHDERRAHGELATMLGFAKADAVSVDGALVPLARAEQARAGAARETPEAAAFEADARAFTARADAQRRRRVPNPTVSVFAERDGFYENVLGLGLSMPLPLPEPLGRMNQGEITESEALARRAKLLAAHSRRRTRSDLLAALASYDSARDAAALFTAERLGRARSTIEHLATDVETARISARDAVILETPLFELLAGAVSARKELCIASAEVVWAAGLDFEGARR
jgi:cobalt-zinc-cadmium efflux system outer membrane protein